MLRPCSVTAVVPTHNRARLLPRTIRSVLAQSGIDLELIVVDDASTDDTERVVSEIRDQRIKYVRLPEKANAAVARNVGAQAGSGQYVAYLDSDDEWLPRHLERKLAVISAEGAAAVVSSCLVSRGGRRWQSRCRPSDPDASWGDQILSGAVDTRSSSLLFRRDALLEIGWDPRLEKHQDWDILIRFSKRFRIATDQTATVIIHADAPGRMSARQNHRATAQFLARHAPELSPRIAAAFSCRLALWTLASEGRSADFLVHLTNAERHFRHAPWTVRWKIRAMSNPWAASSLLVGTRLGRRLKGLVST